MTTPTTVQVKLQLRADTAATWASVNPVLLNNELALETDTKKLKVGNGSTAWNSLAYFPFVVSGGTVLGNLEIGTTGTLTFEGSTADGFETTLGVVNPTADRTINLPNQSGTVIVSGNASIVDADISASAEIAVSKLADGAARQLLQTDAAGTGVEWTDNVDVPGTLDVTGAATFDSSVTITGDLTVNGTTTNINTQNLVVEDKNIILADVTTPTDLTADGGGITLKGATDKTITWSDTTDSWEFNQPTITTGSSTAASFIPTSSTVPSNGVYLPGTNQLALATNATQRLLIDSNGTIDLFNTSRVYNYGNASTFVFRTASGTQASPSAISTSSYVGQIVLNGFSGTNYRTVARVLALSDGAISESSSPGSLIFDTTPSGTITPTERLRITSDGKLGVGTSAPGAILHATSADNAKTAVLAGATNRIRAYGHLASFGGSVIEATNNAESAFAPLLLNGSSLTLGNNGTAIATVTSIGIGIGTTAPSTQLHTYAASGAVTLRVQSGAGIGDFAQAGTELYVANAANGSTSFWTNGSEKARVTSDGKLLVGTSSASTSSTITVQGNSSSSSGVGIIRACCGTSSPGTNDELGAITFGDNAQTGIAAIIGTRDGGTWSASSKPTRLVFHTTADGASSSTARATIDSSGRLLVGTSSAQGTSLSQVEGVAGDTEGPGALFLRRGLTVAQLGAFPGTTLGDVLFGNKEGGVGARIRSSTDGTWSSTSDCPSRLEFSTTADGASSPTERMIISNQGFLACADSGVTAATSGHVFSTSLNNWVMVLNNEDGTNPYGLLIDHAVDYNGTSREFLYCRAGVGNTLRASIRSNGGLANYSANNVNLSDRNAKKDITPAAGTWDCLKAWEIVNFHYKDQPDDADLNMGVIAQQIAESCPEVVTVFQETREATETEPAQEERIGVKDQQMVWMAIKALQEAQLRIETLEAEVAALKAS